MDFAHTVRAEQARHRKAQDLARWCYQRGFLAGVSALPPPLLRFIAQEVGVRAPHHEAGGRSETWERVEELLFARVDWDHRHGVRTPPVVVDIAAAVNALTARTPVCRAAATTRC